MESRSANSPENTQEIKIDRPHSVPVFDRVAKDIVSIDIDLEDLICPLTQELFFEPVLAMPCGHGFESRASSGLLGSSCPSCRQDIFMFGAALAQRREMEKVLSRYPELYAQVYFNLDHFAEVVSNNELNKPIGERFIKLLQHAANHLNDKAIEGKQKNTTGIAVLASTHQGRELLRKDEKIRSLLSPESLQLTVNGQTIAEWIKMEKEEPKTIPVQSVATPASSASASGLFASSSAPSSNVAARAAQPQPADNVWQRVVYGNEAGALQMIRANPRLVEQKATVYDYSNREVDDATPYQAAIRAGDEVMAEKIKAIYLAANPENGQAVLDAQFNEIFPDGYEAHLKAQQASADQFEREYIDPLVNAMTNASRNDIRAALVMRGNGSVVCQRLAAFITAFVDLSLSEKVYNPNHLVKVFEKYKAKCNVWYVNDQNPDRWLRADLFWRHVIGWEERYMTANYAQSCCTGLYRMLEEYRPLQRTLSLTNYHTNRTIQFFPLDSDRSSRLGSDFAVYSYYAAVSPVCAGVRRLPRGSMAPAAAVGFAKLVSRKNSELANLMPLEPRHRASHSCVIQ